MAQVITLDNMNDAHKVEVYDEKMNLRWEINSLEGVTK